MIMIFMSLAICGFGGVMIIDGAIARKPSLIVCGVMVWVIGFLVSWMV